LTNQYVPQTFKIKMTTNPDKPILAILGIKTKLAISNKSPIKPNKGSSILRSLGWLTCLLANNSVNVSCLRKRRRLYKPFSVNKTIKNTNVVTIDFIEKDCQWCSWTPKRFIK